MTKGRAISMLIRTTRTGAKTEASPNGLSAMNQPVASTTGGTNSTIDEAPPIAA